ncbi:hypothetical protein BH20VER2_BH20VER2_19560 [soil metagenome]
MGVLIQRGAYELWQPAPKYLSIGTARVLCRCWSDG